MSKQAFSDDQILYYEDKIICMNQYLLNILRRDTIFDFNLNEWFELARLIITFVSAVIIPIAIVKLGEKISKIQQIEEKLRNDKIEIYNKVLEPFFLIFSTPEIIRGSFKNKESQKKTGDQLAIEKMLNVDFQEYSFKLILLGSDKVVRAYNNLLQAFYNQPTIGNEPGLDLIKYTSVLLLEVRRDLGNSTTKLHEFELLEWKLHDIRTKYFINGKYPNMLDYYRKQPYRNDISTPSETTNESHESD